MWYQKRSAFLLLVLMWLAPWQAFAQARLARDEVKQLKRELRRKGKALAETAALLVLRKKMHAIWGEDEAE